MLFRSTVEDCLAGYLNESKKNKGGVVLMHDLRPQSAEMLAKYIPALKEAGMNFKTLDDIDWDSRK